MDNDKESPNTPHPDNTPKDAHTDAEATLEQASPKAVEQAMSEPEIVPEPVKDPATDKPGEEHSLMHRLGDLTSSAFRFAARTTGRAGKAIARSPDQIKLMMAAGRTLRDLRQVAGLTINELNDALNLKDKTLLEAVENGTATLSFELILRLSALLARNDPIPFVLKFTRTYNPELWKVLNDWGLGRLPLHFERERQFINIYRRNDSARQLSDDGFKRVLDFTRSAFENALYFAAEYEHINQGPSEQRSASSERNGDRHTAKHDSEKSNKKMKKDAPDQDKP